MMQWILAHWRPFTAAALLVLAFAFGRFSAPKPEVKTVTRVEYRDRVVTQVVEKKADAKTVIVYRDTIKRKDGSEEIKETERTDDHQTDTVNENQTADHTGTQTQTVTIHTPLPQWRASLLIGVQPLHLGTPLYGAQVERRVLGPVWLGAFGMGAPGAPWVVGLSAGVEF